MNSLSRRTLLTTAATSGVALATLTTHTNVMAAQDDEKPAVTVGSKNFTEVIILGQMMTLLLENAGFEVETQLNLGGTVVVHEGAVAGDIDVYPEYTGTGLLVILGRDISDVRNAAADSSATPAGTPGTGSVEERTYEIVSEEYPEKFGLEWLKPFGFNNTYVLALRPELAEKYGLVKVSDLQGVANELVFGCSHEFLVRSDGLPNLEKAYDIDFKDAVGFEPALVYSAIEENEVDIIAGAATEGHIERLGLVKLEDDLGYFPPYFAAPVVRQELLENAPDVRNVLNQLAGQIDDQTMGSLNLENDQDGRNPVDIARDFLMEHNLLDSES